MDISVVIPVLDRAIELERAVSSVIVQSHSPLELIIVDDGSERPVEVSWEAPFPIKVIRLPQNQGVSAARNQGIQNATGNWIAFLDSDDEWLPTKLESQVELLRNTQLRFCHTNELWYRNGKLLNQKKKHAKSGGWVYEKCLPLCSISPSTSMIHKSVFEDVGLFREDFPVCEDYDLWLKVTSKYEVGYVESAQIKKYGGHGDQLSQKFFAMDYWRVLALRTQLSNLNLSEKQRSLTLQMFQEKTEILLRGYRKHNNITAYNKIIEIRKTTHEAILSSMNSGILTDAALDSIPTV